MDRLNKQDEIKATDMDKLATIKQIADALIASRKRASSYKANLRTGKAGFLALDSERFDG